jgi:hypothetical protein
MERFLAFRLVDKLGDLNAITPDHIAAFVGKLKAGSLPRRYKSLPSRLRNLFKFRDRQAHWRAISRFSNPFFYP